MPRSGEERKGKDRPRGFHLLAERARACFGVIQGEKFVYVNSHFARRTGFARQELLAADLAELIPPDHRQSVLENIRQGLAGHEESVSFELPLLKKNNEELWLDFSATLIDYLDKPALIGVACDISARKRAEEELRERESRYRTLFASLRETFAVDELLYDGGGNPADWLILDVNPAYEQMFGVDREKVVGQRASVVYGADIVGTYLPLFAQVVGSGHSLRFEYHRGELVSLVSVFPLGNRRLGTLGLDISEHRRVQREREQLLAQVESRAAENDAIINAIADALIIYGPDGEILRMNPVAEKIFHYTPDERSRPLAERAADLALETVAGRPLPLEDTPFWRALHGETISGFVLRFRRNQHRQPLWVSVSAAPVRTGAERMGAVLTFTDITPLRDLQEQREIYLSTISHDLRTPLTIIHGHAQLLDTQAGKGEIAEPARASINAILQGSRLMETMIDALVDSAYLESGQMTLKQEPILLDIFVRDLLQRTRTFLEREQITAEIPDDLPPVFADPVRLERILLNLLANAVKYSAAAAPVAVTGWRIENRVAVSVQDHGRGINPEDLPHIFERFYRTKEGRKGKGIGLGLYIARLLVEAHGGTIRVASTPGEGSTFVFTLPFAASN